jgi:hypothetical protein
MRIIRSHRRTVGGTTIYVKECPTIWVVSRVGARGESGECGVRYKKRNHRTVDALVRDVLLNEQKKYTYTNRLGIVREFYGSYKEFLYIKLNYGCDGLTKEELTIYKTL